MNEIIRRVWMRQIRPRQVKRPRAPRIPPEVGKLISERCDGRCERCARSLSTGGDVHHRIPCGMGGSRDRRLSRPSNLVALCRRCHDDIESNRFVALDNGWLVLRLHDPCKVAISSALHGRVLLDDQGGTTPAPDDEGAA
jgi:5-methylcytosine-specific restriction protein A